MDADTLPDARVEGPGKTAGVMIWRNSQPEQVEMCWGLRPVEGGARPVSLLRAEGREVRDRCLIIANDFYLRPGTAPGNGRRKVEFVTSAPFFCFAGTWSAARRDWPAAFAGLTVPACDDIAPHQDRHMAVVREEDWIEWLRASRPAEDFLRPFPPGSFRVSGPAAPAMGDLFG